MSDFSSKRHRVSKREEFGLMFPRRAPRRRRYSSGAQRAARRRLFVVAAAACVPVLIIAYALTTTHDGRAVDTADVTGAGLQPAYGHSTGGGWRRGGYPMMPGPAGYPSRESAAARNAITAAASENWAGYAAAGTAGAFTRVSASWSEPAVTCTAAQTFSSFWVGLDGDGTSTVEQTGTEADCADGAASYQGWFEMFPAAPVFYSETVRPGDAMSASVVANGGGSFTLTLTDATRGWTKVTDQTSGTAQLGSAEIIAEAPSGGDGDVLPLSDFGSVKFTDALIDTHPIASLNTTEVTMESAGNAAQATPSAITDGDQFTVTVDNSGTTTGTGTGTGGGTGTSGGHRHRHHHFTLGG
jgi:Peptidase A4 family